MRLGLDANDPPRKHPRKPIQQGARLRARVHHGRVMPANSSGWRQPQKHDCSLFLDACTRGTGRNDRIGLSLPKAIGACVPSLHCCERALRINASGRMLGLTAVSQTGVRSVRRSKVGLHGKCQLSEGGNGRAKKRTWPEHILDGH